MNLIKYIKKVRKKEKIKQLTLARYNKETKENIQKWLKIYPNIKKINNNEVAMDITDKHILIVLIKQNSIIEIKDKAFIKIMKEMFEATYKSKPELKVE